MKKLSLIIYLLFITTALFAQNKPVTVSFHNFPWGTSLNAFKAKMGNPVHVEEVNGLQSLVYENITVSGYPVFMIAYFSKTGLEGGTYYFYSNTLEDMKKCYTAVQNDLVLQFGPTLLFDEMLRERRPYETSWNFPSGYVYLKANTRYNEPVSLWYSSPALTKKLNS